jgi:hypothetical protein
MRRAACATVSVARCCALGRQSSIAAQCRHASVLSYPPPPRPSEPPPACQFAFLSFASRAEAARAVHWLDGARIADLQKDAGGITVEAENGEGAAPTPTGPDPAVPAAGGGSGGGGGAA